MITLNKPLILASKSVARTSMLEQVGLSFDSIPADIDEDAYKREGLNPQAIAEALAKAKALHVSSFHPDVLVIGADQVLECEGELLSKADNAEQAKEKLKMLSGRTHRLISAVSVAHGGEILWSTCDEARLTMHDLDRGMLDVYCEKAGAALTRSVGAYELEATGSWLFEKVEGDFFTVLGMPLLPLLSYLRMTHGDAS